MQRWLGGALLLLLACGTDPVARPVDPPSPVDPGVDDDGSRAAIGTGRAFVVNRLVYPEGPGLNHFGPMMNDQVRQSLLGGELLVLLEILGVDRADLGLPDDVTVRTYLARDADEPFFPANNYQVPVGDVTCCEFRVMAASPSEWRIPARIEGNRLIGRGAGASLFALLLGLPEYAQSRDVPIDEDPGTDTSTLSRPRRDDGARTLLDATVSGGWSERGLSLRLAGSVPIASLRERSPFCQSDNELRSLCVAGAETPWLAVATGIGLYPDVDRDGDGLERIEVDASGARCFDGCSGGACSSFVPPMDETDRWSCLGSPGLVDGFQAVAELSAIPATIVGVTR